MLFIGYGLIAVAIGIAALIMLYWAYGYNLDRQGEVQQNGIVFISSSPSQARINLSSNQNTPSNAQTNARLQLRSGDYELKLNKPGYDEWSHKITVMGGDVQHFDYPKLFPSALKTETVRNYPSAPTMAAQSPDRKWLVVKNVATTTDFTVVDLRNPSKLTQTEVNLPENLLTPSNGASSWENIEWANDNQFLLLKYTFSRAEVAAHEYILFDREAPERSLNLTRELKLSPTVELTLFDKKYDKYYIFDRSVGVLKTVSMAGESLSDQLDYVKEFKGYGNDTLLYVTNLPSDGKEVKDTVNVVLRQGSKKLIVTRLPAGDTSYHLDMTRYDGKWYIAVAGNTEPGVHIFRDPQNSLLSGLNLPRPWRFIQVKNPTFVSFSANSRFLMAQSGQNIAVYDAEDASTLRYTLSSPIDAPQTKVRWMDGHRLVYTSEQKLTVVDYDNTNRRSLQTALPGYLPAFSNNYEYVYSFAPTESSVVEFQKTPLVTTAN